MDDETLMGLSYSIIIGTFLYGWKYMPWNMNLHPGMILTPEHHIAYTIMIGGVVMTLFIWAWVAYRPSIHI